MGNNPVAFLIPCHRVIQSTGAFGQYHWGSTRKTAMIGWKRLNKFPELIFITRLTNIQPAMQNIKARIDALDWETISNHINEKGYALIPQLISPVECDELVEKYNDPDLYRKTISMERYRLAQANTNISITPCLHYCNRSGKMYIHTWRRSPMDG